MKIYTFTALVLLSLDLVGCKNDPPKKDTPKVTSAPKVVPQTTTEINYEDPDAINTWIDTILAGVSYVAKKLGRNALPLSDFYLPISPPLLGLTIGATMFKATISGFDTLHRLGSGTLDSDASTLTAYVSFIVGLENAGLHGTLGVSFLNIGADISGVLGHVNANVAIKAMMLPTGASYATLNFLSVTDVGGLSLTITGLGPVLNPMAEQIGQLIFIAASTPILNAVEAALNETITAMLNEPKLLGGKVAELLG